jgi:PAS domain S-box-containing protein
VKEFGIFSVFQRVWRTGKSEYFPPAIYRDERDRETWRESWVYRLTSGEIVTVYNEITERKRAEEALRESEARLNEAQHNAHIGSWRYLPPEMFIWSDEMYELFKLPREIPVTHAAALSQVHPEDRAGNSQGAFKRALESGKAHFSSEYRVIWPDGQIRWMSSIGKIRRDAAGRAIDASGTVQDITERKLTEEALQQSERKYFSLFDGMSEGFGLHELIFDGEGKPCDFRFLELNRAWEEHMGVPRRTVVGRTMKEVWPKLAPYWLELFSKVAMTGDPVRYENMNDELHRWFETFAYSTKRNQFALLSIDITKRKQAEEALSRSEENFRSLFEQAPDGIFTTDADGHFLDANRAGMQMLGYSADELRHLSVSDIVAPEDLHQVGLQLDRLASGELVVSEWRFQPKVGPFRHGELVAKRLSDGRLQAMVRDITDRKQAETALRESERQLNEAQHSAHIGSWRYRPDGTFVVSDEIYELYKLPRDAQVTFESFVAALHPEDQARAAARFQKQLESGALDFSQNEDRVVWPDGQVRNTMSLGKIRRDADGRVIEVVGTAQDVTERVLAEAALRESEEKFRTLADFVPQMVWMCTPDGLNTYFNHRWVEYTGMTLEESYGRGWNTPFHDDDKQKAWDAWNHAVATGDPYRVGSRLRGADGSYRWFLMQGIPLRDASGNIVKWFGSCTDVEDMKHAENALRKAEERFSKAFHNAPMAITISTETDGRYVDVNDAFLDMLGYRREDFVGHTAAELRFWMEMSDREEMLRQLKEGRRGTVAKHNARYQTTKGELREAEVWAQSIELDGQPCVLAITRDITEIRLLEAEFRQAQKMEAVGLLAGGVAHDFNNLLMIIGSYARLIPMHIEDRKKVERDAMQIDEAVSRAASVTRQLLAFSRKQVLQPTVLSVNSLVLTLSKMLPRLLGEDVEMSLVRNATGKVKADATQLEQVILNLAVNARDAMPSGGKLIIETADVNSDGVYPRHPGTVIPAGDYVMIAR